VNGRGVTKIVDARPRSARNPNSGAPGDLMECVERCRVAHPITLIADEEWAMRHRTVPALCAPLEVLPEAPLRRGREWNQSRLVEFGSADAQNSVSLIKIAQREREGLADPHAGNIEQPERKVPT
jgi:hypothetical protein